MGFTKAEEKGPSERLIEDSSLFAMPRFLKPLALQQDAQPVYFMLLEKDTSIANEHRLRGYED